MIPIVDSRFQWKYTLLVTALGVGVTAVMGGLLYRAHRDNTNLLSIDPRLQEQVVRGDQIFLLYLIICVIGMAVVLCVWGLVVTHRISGPLYLVARYLDVIAEGTYPDVRPLRKRDELHSFFTTFDDAVSTLKKRDEDNAKALNDTLAAAKSKFDSDPKGALDALQTGVKTVSDALNAAVKD